MGDLIVDKYDWQFLSECRTRFSSDFSDTVIRPTVNSMGGHYRAPAAIHEIETQLKDLHELVPQVSSRDEHFAIPAKLLPFLKLTLIHGRRTVAAELDRAAEKTYDPDLRASLRGALEPYEKFMTDEWFRQTATFPMPLLTDFLTLEQVEKSDFYEPLAPRVFDEKFHTLLSPSLFAGDLAYYRYQCYLRGKPVAVAFVDIDDFKAFNEQHGESHIDSNLLPTFMAAVEAHVFGRGFAYRYGGDEYLVLMPNATEENALAILDTLRRDVKELHYRDIVGHTTVSIGVCVADRNSFLTDMEMKTHANNAKQFAKKHGKDCIASFKTDIPRAEDLYIARPVGD